MRCMKMVRTVLSTTLVVVALFTAGTEGTELYVATNGNDAWSGRLPSPDATGKDGPFVTLERARDELRKLKAKGSREAFTVWVRNGTYALPRTFTLGPEDAGTANAPVKYRAFKDERPVLTGNRKVSGFQSYRNQILKADVGAQGLRGVYFRQLFFEGKRQHLARYPNVNPDNPLYDGWAYVDGTRPSKPVTEDRRTLRMRASDMKTWSRLAEGEVFIFPYWNYYNNILRIASLDRGTRTLTLGSDAFYEILPGDRYFLRNLFEELDAPGEWYLDRESWILYFWPPRAAQDLTAYVPVVDKLIEIRGSSHITIRGFVIEGAEGTAVSLHDSSNCLIAGNTIRNVVGRSDGSLAAVVVEGGEKNGVVGNDIYDVGSHGIVMSGGDRKTLTPAGHYADNNYIHHTGVFWKQGVAVSVGGVGNRVSHNLIHDLPRFAVLFSGNDHVIECNRIHHVGLETQDVAAVYTVGRDWVTARGSAIRFNLITDVLGYGLSGGKTWVSPFLSWGIYLDDAAAGVDVIGNIVARTARSSVQVHNGRDNVIENNILVDGALWQVEFNGWTKDHPFQRNTLPTMMQNYREYGSLPAWQKYRGFPNVSPEDAAPMAHNRFVRNIVSYRNPDAKLYRQVNLPVKEFESDYNTIYHFGKPVLITELPGLTPEKQWAAWQEKGLDRHSVIADPVFASAENDDYRLRAASPALKLGFEQIPIERIGPYRDELRASWPITEAPGVYRSGPSRQ